MDTRLPHHIAITYSTVKWVDDEDPDGYEEDHGWATPGGEHDSIAEITDNSKLPSDEDIYKYYSEDMDEQVEYEIGTLEEWVAEGSTPEEYESEKAATLISVTASYLKDHAVEASSSGYHPGIWYVGGDESDMYTGEHVQYSYHLKGYTPEEEEAVFANFEG